MSSSGSKISNAAIDAAVAARLPALLDDEVVTADELDEFAGSLPGDYIAPQVDTALYGASDLRWQTAALNGGGLVITGPGDSTTDGAGGSNFRTEFAKRMRAVFGDGGPGLHLFNNGVASDQGATFAKTGGVGYIDLGLATPTTYSDLVLGGLFTDGTATNESFSWQPASAWDSVRVLYLKLPGGGTGKLRLTTAGAGTGTTINTGTVNADGSGGAVSVAAVGYVDLANPSNTAAGIAFDNIAGATAWVGGDFKWSANPTGYRQGSYARGGIRCQQIAGQSMTILTQLLAALSPVAMVHNLGMNDRTSRTPNQFQTDLTTVLTACKAGAPSAVHLVVSGNEPGDAASTYFAAYPQVKQAVARSLGLSYTDDVAVLGRYATANAAGLMAAGDAIHPSAAGNGRRAQGYVLALGLPVGLKDPGLTPRPAGGAGTPTYYGTLTRKRGSNTSGQALVAYKLGLTNGFPTGIFTFKAYTQRNGTSAGVVREFTVTLSNGSVTNQVTTASAVTNRLVHTVNAGDAQTLDVTASVAVVANLAEVTFTFGAFAGLYDIYGSYVFLNLTQNGPSVTENA